MTKKDILITIDPTTRVVYFEDGFIGVSGENLQGNIVFKFKDGFVNGTPSVEIEKGNNKYVITEITKLDETYVMPIKSSLLTDDKVEMNLMITEDSETPNVPIFKSRKFTLRVANSVEATEVIPDEYDTWYSQISEKIEELENINANVITGVGRPDKPETTQGKITGNEPVGTIYISTDGANVGAWVWTKYGDDPNKVYTARGWVVTAGDTGNVIVIPTNIKGDAKIVFRRINNTVFSSLGFQGQWGTFGIDENATLEHNRKITLGVVPQGFGTNTAQTTMISKDGEEMLTNAIYNVLTRADGGKIQIRTPNSTVANSLKGQTLLRASSIRWVTNEPYPDSL
jgi:DNA-directed RNA polymerase subunit L